MGFLQTEIQTTFQFDPKLITVMSKKSAFLKADNLLKQKEYAAFLTFFRSY